MRAFLKNTAIILTFAGSALATTAAAGADGFAAGFSSGRGDRHGTVVSIGFGDVAYGYRDGYWDNGHRWHRWNNDHDYNNYRAHHTGYFRDWNHDRNGGNGWQRDWESTNFDNVAFAYRDGYWDNGRRWHQWNDDRDYRNYRKHNAGNYRDWNHDRDGSDGWKRDRDNGGRY